MRFYIKGIFFTLIAVFIYGCSADYLSNRAQYLTAITLKANVETTTIGINQTLELIVEGDDGEDYTAESVITVNGEPIQGSTYSFSEEGQYVFSATYQDYNSNTIAFNVVTERFLVVDKSKVFRNQTVQFKLLNPDGTDATQEAEFYVNGDLIVGSSVTTAELGVYTVFAVYDNGLSQTGELTFEVFIPKRKVVYEDYTGTWCGWCVRVTTAVQAIKELTDDVVIVAIHNNDPMAFPLESQLADAFNVLGYPTAKVNRTQTVPTREDDPENIQLVVDQAGVDSDLSIAINTNLSGNNLVVEVKLMSETNIPATHKVVVYIYQNGVVFPQQNYYNTIASSPWYQVGDPINDFVHDDVLETSLTNIFGDQVQATEAFEVYSKSYPAMDLSQFTYTASPNTYDPTRFGVAVYVVDENNNALNAQHVKAGQSVNFE